MQTQSFSSTNRSSQLTPAFCDTPVEGEKTSTLVKIVSPEMSGKKTIVREDGSRLYLMSQVELRLLIEEIFGLPEI